MFTTESSLVKHEDRISFEKMGYAVVSNEMYEDSQITYSFPTPNNIIGISPKFLSGGNHLFVAVESNGHLVVGAIIRGNSKTYRNTTVTLEEVNTITVRSHNDRFFVFFNDLEVVRFQSSVFVNGTIRVAGDADESFYSCRIEEYQSPVWISNAGTPGVEIKYLPNEEIRLSATGEEPAHIWQQVSATAGEYTLSFESKGHGLAVFGGIGEVFSDDWEVHETTAHFEEGMLAVEFITAGEPLHIRYPQIEEGTRRTAHIRNESFTESAVREESILSYPMKGLFNTQTGSIYTRITLPSRISGEQMIWGTDTDEFTLSFTDEVIVFEGPGGSISSLSNSYLGKSVEIVTNWNTNEITLQINEEYSIAPIHNLDVGNVSSITFAGEGLLIEEVILEEWALFGRELLVGENVFEITEQALMHSLFDGGISGSNVTWHELPVAPDDHSPILVEKVNGESLQKVSFFDFETGEYRAWNKEFVTYDGRSDFIEVAYSGLNEDFRSFGIFTEEGEKIGEPYTVDGRRIYVSFSPFEKILYKRTTLYAQYQVNDTYTIDYNIEAVDGFRIDFAKHDGTERVVFQEGNRHADQVKLATMVDMNPIQNQNHQGFMYITNTVNPTVSFRVTMTPDRVLADGRASSTLVIEPLDHQGNFVSHSNLEIVTQRGFVARHISQDAVEAQKRSGQYLYEYVAPFLNNETNPRIVEDSIWITDTDNNIGINTKIILSPVEEPSNYRLSRDEMDILTQKTQIINYILMYEGTEPYEDAELVSILDLNEDGRITVEDVAELHSNKMDAELMIILNRMREWEEMQ